MNISYYNYKRMHEFLREDIKKEFEIVLSLDGDPEIFYYMYKNEKKIGKALGRGYFRGTSSGTAAMQFSLIALGVGEGDEVITTSSNIATMLSISNAGAKPVLVDIRQDTMLMDLNQIDSVITKKTKAVIPVHLYGQMVDMDKISKIAKRHNLFAVEDAAHAHLARFRGKLPGRKSDCACYSLFLNKSLGGISNGGMVVTKSRKMYKEIEKLRNNSSNSPLLLRSKRTPGYLDWMQIAFLLCKIKYIERWTNRRREIAKMYLDGLSGLPITLPVEDKGAYHVYRDFAIRTGKRDKLKKYLSRNSVQTAIHYPEACHLSGIYSGLGYKKGDFPVAEESFSRVISLPANPFVTDDEADYVIKMVKKFFG